MLDTVAAAEGAMGIVMPMFGHAGLLAEAIHSIRQSEACGLDVHIFVSVDGDPQEEAFDVLVAEGAMDERLHVLLGDNGGPGRARNRAIAQALKTLPDLRAIYFLDADNRVLPTTLRKLWEHMRSMGAGWVYTNIDAFSVNWTSHYGNAYSRLAHLVFDNICDTGSLVDAAVFRSGVRFDENPDNGFEDWDFWLTCLEHGFTGARCPDAAFEYRLRADSRFRQANRRREASLSVLRRRHRKLFRRDRLVGFEHEDAPRYLLLLTGTDRVLLFSDPRANPQEIDLQEAALRYWSANAEPDNHHFPPFVLAASEAAYRQFQHSRLLPNILSRIEVMTAEVNVVYVDVTNDREQRSVDAATHETGLCRSRPADMVALRVSLLRDVLNDNALDWFRSLASPQTWPTAGEIALRTPLQPGRRLRLASSEQAVTAFADRLAGSLFRNGRGRRWTWRRGFIPSGAALLGDLENTVGGAPVLPLGPQPEGRRTAAILTPIAAYGGAEKVAYACARALKEAGFETHLFVLGSSSMAILDTFDAGFDFIHIWDKRVPVWGADRRFIGHDFIDDNPDVNWRLLQGQLSGFDLVVNNHVLPAHPLMGRLRADGARTVCYLHVVDHTPLGRPAGQPYAALAFEHAYDAFVTCSEQLKRYLHSFGVADGKIFSVVNGPGFELAPDVQERCRARRDEDREAPLRLLFLGRFDVQKGVDRLYAILRRLHEAEFPFVARVVGGELIKDATASWTERLAEYATVLPPAYSASDLAAHFGWSDATLLPSRWEGAPLVVREAQYMGSIPISIDVGAVCEQIEPGVDGLLVANAHEAAIVSEFVAHIRTLGDSERRRRLATQAMETCDRHSWREAFGDFIAWAERIPAANG